MLNKSGKTNAKRLPKGQRTHARRLKQAARKEVTQVNTHSSPAQPPRVPKKQDNPEETKG